MKPYAVSNDCYGLADTGKFNPMMLVHREDGQWYKVYGDLEVDQRFPLDGQHTVYRLTGWGADEPSEMWVEPMEPVPVRVGMEVVDKLPNEDALPIDERVFGIRWLVHACGKHYGGTVYLKWHGWPVESQMSVGRPISTLRCALTGAPLCLPKEPTDA